MPSSSSPRAHIARGSPRSGGKGESARGRRGGGGQRASRWPATRGFGEARLIDGSVLVVGRTTFVAFAEASRGRRSREEILDGRDAKFRIAVDTAIDAALEGRTVVAIGEPGSGRAALAHAIHEVAVGPHLPFVRLALGGAGVEGSHALDAPVGTIFVHDLGNLPVGVYGRIVELMRRGAPSLEHPALPSGRLQMGADPSRRRKPDRFREVGFGGAVRIDRERVAFAA